MNKMIDELFGHGEDITALQMSVRAAVMFVVVLILIRIGGVRIFGKRSGFDIIIMITMGSVVARGIVGASPYLATMAAAATMIFIHRLLGWLSAKNGKAERLIKGSRSILYKDGKVFHKNLRLACLSTEDLQGSLHLEMKEVSLEKVHVAYLETNGRISFIMKKEQNDTGTKKDFPAPRYRK